MKDEGHRIKDKIVTTLRTQQTKVISLLSFILYLFIPFCGWMPNVPSRPLTPSPLKEGGGGVHRPHRHPSLLPKNPLVDLTTTHNHAKIPPKSILKYKNDSFGTLFRFAPR